MSTAHTKEHDPVLTRACVVIPMYNEAAVIVDVVRAAREQFGRVVCVDDGSSDESPVLARAAGATVVLHPINLGAGAATLTGIKRALQDPAVEWIATVDADGQHSAEDAAAMVRAGHAAGVQVVFGSRFLGRIEGISTRRLRLLKWATRFTRVTTGLNVTDAHNGLRVFHRDAAEQLKFRLHGMSHASELATQVARNKWTYVEYPTTITYTAYSQAKGQRNYNALNVLFDLALDRLRAPS